MLEFVLLGVPAIFVLISVFQMGIGMWEFHTIDSAVHQLGRYMQVRGRGCTQNSNTCSVTVGQIATQMESYAIGIPGQLFSVTLVNPGGNSISCSPLSSCTSNAIVWPQSPYNGPGQIFVIYATFNWSPAIGMVWPGAKTQIFPTYTIGSSTAEEIMF
jgi:hypothetical protein